METRIGLWLVSHESNQMRISSRDGPLLTTTGNRLVLALALIAMLCGGVLRFTAIDQIGLKGSDNTYYTNIARYWAEGDRVHSIADGDVWHRPVVYAVFSLAIRTFGFDDASIKRVNASLDTINILLIFLLALILSRGDPRVASAAAVVYALLPFTILISRSEQTHVLSTTTLLTASILVSLIRFTEHRAGRLLLALIAGITTGLCALTHEELIFTAAGPAIFLILLPPLRDHGLVGRVFERAGSAGTYIAGVLAPAYGMLQMHQTEAQVRATEVATHRIEQAAYLPIFEHPLKFGWNAVTACTSILFASLVIILAVVLVVRAVLELRRKRTRPALFSLPIEDLPLWTIVLFMLLYGSFFIYYAARLFIPLVPLLIAWLLVRAVTLLDRWLSPRLSHLALGGLTAAIVVANLGHISAFSDFRYSHFNSWTRYSLAADLSPAAGWRMFHQRLTNPSWARRRFDELGACISDDARLLVGTSTFHPFPGRRLLQIGYYFGDNAIYLFDHDQPIDELIEEKSIRFVIFTAYQTVWQTALERSSQGRYLYDDQWSAPEPVVLGRSLGFADGEYSLLGEFDRLSSYLSARGARIIIGRGELLTQRPTKIGMSSFVVWTLDPHRWPSLELEIATIDRSVELAAEGRPIEAIEALGEAEAKVDTWGRFRLRLTQARLLAEQHRPGKARQKIDEALALLPRNTTVATALRDLYPTRDAIEEMQHLFTQVQEKSPTNTAVRNLLLGFAVNLAELAIEENNANGTIEAFREIELQLQIRGQRQFTLAIADWCTTAARSLARQGRVPETEAGLTAASTAYNRSLDTGRRPSPLMLAMTGSTLSDIGHSNLAVEPLQQALEAMPRNAGIWAHLCLAHQRNGDHVQATDACRQAISLDPNHSWARLITANLLADQGNWSAAFEQARTSATNPRSSSSHTPELINLASRIAAAGHRDDACDLLSSIRRPDLVAVADALESLGCTEVGDAVAASVTPGK